MVPFMVSLPLACSILMWCELLVELIQWWMLRDNPRNEDTSIRCPTTASGVKRPVVTRWLWRTPKNKYISVRCLDAAVCIKKSMVAPVNPAPILKDFVALTTWYEDHISFGHFELIAVQVFLHLALDKFCDVVR
jgi:hypothetical protein